MHIKTIVIFLAVFLGGCSLAASGYIYVVLDAGHTMDNSYGKMRQLMAAKGLQEESCNWPREDVLVSCYKMKGHAIKMSVTIAFNKNECAIFVTQYDVNKFTAEGKAFFDTILENVSDIFPSQSIKFGFDWTEIQKLKETFY